MPANAIRAVLVCLAAILSAPTFGAEPTGVALPGLEPYDKEMQALLTKWDIPGASLAVAKDGKLLLARGYGITDRKRPEPMQPANRFRLGSLAKPVTAVAALLLVEDGRLKLDEKMMPLLGELVPRAAAITDPRVHDITVRHLLQHTAGFDRDKSGDPLFQPRINKVIARQNFSGRPTCEAILKDTLEQGLDFAPGERHAYSNVGYCILGRIVERLVGESFEAFVRRRVFAPAGIRHIELGRTIESLPGEVAYHDYPGAPFDPFVQGYGTGRTTRAYGTYPLEAMDALGQWVGSPVDFLRFFMAIDGQRGAPLLKSASVREMRTKPRGVSNQPGPVFYGLGVNFRESGGGHNWWHAGAQPGVRTLAVRTAAGFAWVVAFNGRPKSADFAREFDQALWRAWRAVDARSWPRGDLMDELQ